MTKRQQVWQVVCSYKDHNTEYDFNIIAVH